MGPFFQGVLSLYGAWDVPRSLGAAAAACCLSSACLSAEALDDPCCRSSWSRVPLLWYEALSPMLPLAWQYLGGWPEHSAGHHCSNGDVNLN